MEINDKIKLATKKLSYFTDSYNINLLFLVIAIDVYPKLASDFDRVCCIVVSIRALFIVLKHVITVIKKYKEQKDNDR